MCERKRNWTSIDARSVTHFQWVEGSCACSGAGGREFESSHSDQPIQGVAGLSQKSHEGGANSRLIENGAQGRSRTGESPCLSICTGATIRDSRSRLDRLLNHITAHEVAGLPGRHPGSSGALDPAVVRRDLLGTAPALLDALPMSFDCDMAYTIPASLLGSQNSLRSPLCATTA